MKTDTLTLQPEVSDRSSQTINHFALIPDGNRRWARARGLHPGEGHRVAFLEKAPELLKHIWANGIHTATLWMFSHDNWKRSEEEVDTLMELYRGFLRIMLLIAEEMQVSLVHLGRKDRIPVALLKEIHLAEFSTKHYDKHSLLFAIDYSGRDELFRMVKHLLVTGRGYETLTPEKLCQLLDTGEAQFPDPDIVMRTSGETRTSGFMPWQSAYSEYFFAPEYFPDLQVKDIDEVLRSYQNRNRRYGC